MQGTHTARLFFPLLFGLGACAGEETKAYHSDCGDASTCESAGGSASGGSASGGSASGGSASGGGSTGGIAAGGEAAGGAAAGGQAGGGDASGGAGGAGGAGGSAPSGARIGAECVEPADCASGFCLDSEFAQSVAMDPEVMVPGGYCTDLACRATADCHQEDASCIDFTASGLELPFLACFQTCDPDAMPLACRADHACYCDPEGDITDTEAVGGHCLCLPEVLVDLLSGE